MRFGLVFDNVLWSKPLVSLLSAKVDTICKANDSSCQKLPISSLYAMRLVLWWLHWKLCGNHTSPFARLLDSQKYYRANYGGTQVQSFSHLITEFQTWPHSGGGTMSMMRVPVFGCSRRGEMKWTRGWAKLRSKYFGPAWWQVLLSGWGSISNSFGSHLCWD